VLPRAGCAAFFLRLHYRFALAYDIVLKHQVLPDYPPLLLSDMVACFPHLLRLISIAALAAAASASQQDGAVAEVIRRFERRTFLNRFFHNSQG
jgi:hypothetical protein